MSSKQKLSDKIDELEMIAHIHDLKLSNHMDYKRANGISDYIDYKINRVLTKLKIK